MKSVTICNAIEKSQAVGFFYGVDFFQKGVDFFQHGVDKPIQS